MYGFHSNCELQTVLEPLICFIYLFIYTYKALISFNVQSYIEIQHVRQKLIIYHFNNLESQYLV